MKGTGQYVAVTGCDTGIGHCLARELARRGYRVLASYIENDPFPVDSGIRGFRLDITSEGQRAAFAAFIVDAVGNGAFHCLVHNAGIGLGGPIEDLPLEDFRRVFEVNFFGPVSLTQKCIPLLARDRGRIVIVGSMAGRVALPFMAPYASSKFAVEGFADSLRRELLPLGVRTVLVEPAAVATPIWNKSRDRDVSFAGEKYRESLAAFREGFIESGNRGLAPERAAGRIADIIGKKNPARRYIVAKNRLVSYVETLLPAALLDRAVMKLFRMNYGKG